MATTGSPVQLAGAPLGDCRHVCAFFLTSDDEYHTLLPFLCDGIASGDRDVIIAPRDRTDHVGRLRGVGLDVDSLIGRHQLAVLRSEDTYMTDGRFDQEAMLATLPRLLEAGRRHGFGRTRLVAHAEFVLDEHDDALAFAEYEARLNEVLPGYPDLVICTYDLGQIGAAATIDALRTHPMVIIAGVLRRNPFYVKPDEFVRQVRRRREWRLAAARP
jgi:hypothetical protein